MGEEEMGVIESVGMARFKGIDGLMRGCDRFFWLALYAQPGLWVGLAIFALVRLENPIWLSLNGKGTLYCGRNSVRGSLLTRFGDCSHCVNSYNHEYACFLAMR